VNRSLTRKSIVVGAGGMLAAGLLATAATATAANAATVRDAAPAARGPAWHRVLSLANNPVSNPDGTYVRFDAVVATGKTTGWAFRSDSAVAYERVGVTAWRKVAFPGGTGTVEAAAATSPSSVWAAYDSTSGGQVSHWNGRRWTPVKTFPAAVTGITTLGPNDVWVYGGVRSDGTGVWHYNGRTWTEVSDTLSGGSALSDRNVWAYSYEDNTVDHWDGRKWTATSVASLVGPPSHRPPQVTGVIALAPGNVYATGISAATPIGGPLVVLHYNGRGWTKVAGGFGSHREQRMVSDGRGGLWLAADASVGGQGAVLHYSGGKLTEVSIPAPASLPVLPFSLSLIRGTGGLLVGGVQYVTADGSKTNSVVLQYS
jgi:hypothetical protein